MPVVPDAATGGLERDYSSAHYKPKISRELSLYFINQVSWPTDHTSSNLIKCPLFKASAPAGLAALSCQGHSGRAGCLRSRVPANVSNDGLQSNYGEPTPCCIA